MVNKKTNKEVNQMFYPILPYRNLDKDHRLKLFPSGTSPRANSDFLSKAIFKICIP